MPVNKGAFSEHCPSSSRMLCREKRLCCSALPHFFELCSKALNLSFCLWSCFRNLSFCFINSGTKGYHYSLSFSRSILCILSCLDFLKEKKIFPVSCKQLKHWMASKKTGPYLWASPNFLPQFQGRQFFHHCGDGDGFGVDSEEQVTQVPHVCSHSQLMVPRESNTTDLTGSGAQGRPLGSGCD